MASTTPRFGTTVGSDNTGRVLTMGYATPAYAATINLKPNAWKTLVVVAQLTGAATINVSTERAQASDELVILLSADGTNRVATLGTGTKTSGTVTVTASKKGSISFVFDGTDWVETGRAVTA